VVRFPIILLPVSNAFLSLLKQKPMALLKRTILGSLLLNLMEVGDERLLLPDCGEFLNQLFELFVIFGVAHEGLEDGRCILFLCLQRYLIVGVKEFILKDKFFPFCSFLQPSVVLLDQSYFKRVLLGSIGLVELKII